MAPCKWIKVLFLEASTLMTILGIDAAWTATQPTGVALVIRKNDSWETVSVAPSYASFVDCVTGEKPNWSRTKFSGAKPVMCDLLTAAETIAGRRVDLVAIDMPVSTERITGRRVADDTISKRFGKYGCAAHTPSERRPGQLGEEMMDALTELGYPVATSTCIGGTPGRTIEVYPHPALLSLLGLQYRLAYKVSKSRRFWPRASVA